MRRHRDNHRGVIEKNLGGARSRLHHLAFGKLNENTSKMEQQLSVFLLLLSLVFFYPSHELEKKNARFHGWFIFRVTQRLVRPREHRKKERCCYGRGDMISVVCSSSTVKQCLYQTLFRESLAGQSRLFTYMYTYAEAKSAACLRWPCFPPIFFFCPEERIIFFKG